MTEWQPIETNPHDGTPFWAYLHQIGVRKLKWMTAEQIAEYEGHPNPEVWEASFVEDWNPREAWEPEWWMPEDAIPDPPND